MVRGARVEGWKDFSIRYHEILEAPSKKGRSRAVGLRSVLLLASACNSLILERHITIGKQLKSYDLQPHLVWFGVDLPFQANNSV